MARFVLNLEVTLTFDEVKRKLKLEGKDYEEDVFELFEKAIKIAKPKAVYKECFIDEISGNDVIINGEKFSSEIMTKNLEGLHRVFAYALTCGTEVDEWSHQEDDYMSQMWLDTIKEMILYNARNQFIGIIKEKYKIEKTSTMNPGSGNADVWPIFQQVGLFKLLENVTEDTGIVLQKSMLMTPTKSVSGILFPSDKEYVNCAYCTKEECPGRKVAYNPELLIH